MWEDNKMVISCEGGLGGGAREGGGFGVGWSALLFHLLPDFRDETSEDFSLPLDPDRSKSNPCFFSFKFVARMDNYMLSHRLHFTRLVYR